MEDSCRPARRVVAQGPVCTVEQCACGVLHVTIGVLTIRLQTEVVASIWETLGEALHRVCGRPRSTHPIDELPTDRTSTERPS